MTNQAQIDAVEQLLMAVLKTNGTSLSVSTVFQKAESALMGENGPPGTEQKSKAANYLAHLKRQLK